MADDDDKKSWKAKLSKRASIGKVSQLRKEGGPKPRPMSVHAGVTRAASAGITRAQTEPSVLELAVSSAAETRSEEGPAPKLEHITATRAAVQPGRRPPTRKPRPPGPALQRAEEQAQIQPLVKARPPMPPKPKPIVAAPPPAAIPPPIAAIPPPIAAAAPAPAPASNVQTVGTKQVIRVFNDNAGTTSKTLPITLPCTIESLADQMRKKMRGEDTSEYWIHEVKETKDVRILPPEAEISDVMRAWNNNQQFKFVFKKAAPGLEIPKKRAPSPLVLPVFSPSPIPAPTAATPPPLAAATLPPAASLPPPPMIPPKPKPAAPSPSPSPSPPATPTMPEPTTPENNNGGAKRRPVPSPARRIVSACMEPFDPNTMPEPPATATPTPVAAATSTPTRQFPARPAPTAAATASPPAGAGAGAGAGHTPPVGGVPSPFGRGRPDMTRRVQSAAFKGPLVFTEDGTMAPAGGATGGAAAGGQPSSPAPVPAFPKSKISITQSGSLLGNSSGGLNNSSNNATAAPVTPVATAAPGIGSPNSAGVAPPPVSSRLSMGPGMLRRVAPPPSSPSRVASSPTLLQPEQAPPTSALSASGGSGKEADDSGLAEAPARGRGRGAAAGGTSPNPGRGRGRGVPAATSSPALQTEPEPEPEPEPVRRNPPPALVPKPAKPAPVRTPDPEPEPAPAPKPVVAPKPAKPAPVRTPEPEPAPAPKPVVAPKPAKPAAIPEPEPEPEPESVAQNGASDAPYKSKDPATWSIDDVAAWLQDIGLEQLRESFTENEISGSELLDLTMDEIKEDLDVKKLGTRKALWREIQALKSE